MIRNCFLLLLLFLANPTFAIFQTESNTQYYKRFQEVFEKVEKEYVKEPKKQELIDAAIEGMLTSLDPHSCYIIDDDLEYFVNNFKGEFAGIGVEIIFENGAIKVISPIDDLAAYKAGVKAGDYIVKVNDDFISSLGFNKALAELRGEVGTKVKITVVRDGETKPLEFELTREIVTVNPVKSHIDNNIAYLRISSFSEKAYPELKKAMNNLEQKNKDKIKGIILDLRNNPGGILLPTTIDVAGYFFKWWRSCCFNERKNS